MRPSIPSILFAIAFAAALLGAWVRPRNLRIAFNSLAIVAVFFMVGSPGTGSRFALVYLPSAALLYLAAWLLFQSADTRSNLPHSIWAVFAILFALGQVVLIFAHLSERDFLVPLGFSLIGVSIYLARCFWRHESADLDAPD